MKPRIWLRQGNSSEFREAKTAGIFKAKYEKGGSYIEKAPEICRGFFYQVFSGIWFMDFYKENTKGQRKNQQKGTDGTILEFTKG
jgi:hypothetical protein